MCSSPFHWVVGPIINLISGSYQLCGETHYWERDYAFICSHELLNNHSSRGKGWGKFNESCLRFFFFFWVRGLGVVRYPSFLIPLNWGNFEGELFHLHGKWVKMNRMKWIFLRRVNYSKPLVVRSSFTLPTRGLKSITLPTWDLKR